MSDKYIPLQPRDFDFCSKCEELEQQLQQKEDELEKANKLLVKVFEQDRFNEDYFDLALINQVRLYIENH